MVAGSDKEGSGMKNCLLFLAVVAALMVGVPAYSQHVFLDVDGDGLSSTAGQGGNDALTTATTSVDVYFVTDTNRDGSAAVCSTSPDPFSIISYEFTLLSSGTGTVSYGAWTDNMGFTVKLTPPTCTPYCSSGPAAWIAMGGAVAAAPGKYKVGTLAITVSGSPRIDVLPGHDPLSPVSQTAFGSHCLGGDFDNTIKLGSDFFDADGTDSATPVVPTTWGKIKELYN
jgi:hypothetical protein